MIQRCGSNVGEAEGRMSSNGSGYGVRRFLAKMLRLPRPLYLRPKCWVKKRAITPKASRASGILSSV